MVFRVTQAGRDQYVPMARSYRDAGGVRQQALLSLGRLDVLQASGQLDALLRSELRLSRRWVVLEAQAAGQTEAVVVRKIGPDLVFGRLWEPTGIAACLRAPPRQAVLTGLLAERRYQFDMERAVYLAGLQRLVASGSDRAAALPLPGASLRALVNNIGNGISRCAGWTTSRKSKRSSEEATTWCAPSSGAMRAKLLALPGWPCRLRFANADGTRRWDGNVLAQPIAVFVSH